MRLAQSFDVPVPVERAWTVLLDLERVAPCMPGAALTQFDGQSFTGTVKVKLGPVSLSYKGQGEFVERDEMARRVVLVASGQDSRGAGGASVRVTAVLHETDGGAATRVEVLADLDIAGRAAQFGRGMIADVSTKLVKQFSDCLATTIAAQAPAAPATHPAVAPASATASGSAAVSGSATVPESGESIVEASARLSTTKVSASEQSTVDHRSMAPPVVAPIDLLAISGAAGMLRRFAPYLIVAGLAVVVLLIWLVVA